MDLSPDEDNFQGRLLHQAALWDNAELLQELLATGADADARDASARSALHAAALAERSRCLAALCAAGADVDAKSDDATGGKTALHISAERGHVENISALLSSGANVEIVDASGNTALALAERGGHRHAALALREARDALERSRLVQHAQLRSLVSRGEVQLLKAKLSALGSSADLVLNMTPGGANTLLFVAAELGNKCMVVELVAAGADGRAHPVTKYSPLYVACYRGHLQVAQTLLDHFPQHVQLETVERWLPLHAACIGGHAELVSMLLQHKYPDNILNTFTDPTGKFQYRFAFDLNAVDARGQTALYVACTLGNLAVVDALLAARVACTPLEEEPPAPAQSVLSPNRSGISLGIHAIVNKLAAAINKTEPPISPVRPLAVDGGPPGDSCLGAAVRSDNVKVVAALLNAGAKPDAPSKPPNHVESSSRDARRRSRSASAGPRTARSPGFHNNDEWTALGVACARRAAGAAELLVSRGACEPRGAALRHCGAALPRLLPALLAARAYTDTEHKVNSSAVCLWLVRSGAGSACPATPVAVNWRGLANQPDNIDMCWVVASCTRLNPRAGGASVHALTRLDVSNNELCTLPPELFQLLSLRYLNAAQNKLERLPPEFVVDEDDRRKKKRTPREVYTAPVLQELYLQDNRLEDIPPALFSLPSLSTLDVSNNKLRALPARVWNAPALRDLNVALNHLRSLPAHETVEGQATSPDGSTKGSLSSANSKDSRSLSVDTSEMEPSEEEVPLVVNRAGNAVCTECRQAHPLRTAEPPPAARGRSALASLNLSHNQFTGVPPPLACLAPNLATLNMAYNSLRSMSYVTSYPASLRQLDLSHNEITCWPSLPQPQVEGFTPPESDPLACYCAGGGRRPRPRSGSARDRLLGAACEHRRHLRLNTLRTLILANNLLTRIQLTTDDDGVAEVREGSDDEDDEWNSESSLRGRLLFPLLSMLDVSHNLLRAVPPAIRELTNLAVLNVSGNKDITDLPPQMGLLSRLWNLNTNGCSLGEPLRSMLAGGRYKSMDVVGYLKSILQEARQYATLKLMLVGRQGIGKTSLLECLRQESAIHHRRKPTEHWAKRMGNKSTRRGNLSTVGVDIGTWVYEKHRSTRGPVTYRTWDFGGQEEYYATHQYFLSRRSLYLVVWRVIDGRKGLAEALGWLRSIQARAPGSPVIMVATHYDQVENVNLSDNETPDVLQRIIRTSIMGALDADKLGLPKVMDSVEVSCSTRHNIRLLADMIYCVSWGMKPPGCKSPLLGLPVPASYLALEECVTTLAAELPDPVLTAARYRDLVSQYMASRQLRWFRGNSGGELGAASAFLHDCGVLLHYDDANLRDLYFLRPQWLCDVLAHLVSVRELNPFACNGIMKLEDLSHVFKASPALGGCEDAGALGAALLNKFELALAVEPRALLLPPLAPITPPAMPQLPVRARSWGGRRTWPAAGRDSPALIQDAAVSVSGRCVGAGLRRVLVASYVPPGFWPRLATRLAADGALAAAPRTLYASPRELEVDDTISRALDLSWGWKIWRTGVEMSCGDLTLLRLRELPPRRDALLPPDPVDEQGQDIYSNVRFRILQDGAWCDLEVDSSYLIELHLPAQVCVLRREDQLPIAGQYQSVSLEPNPETLATVLALVSDHVDLLLEDWYPSLGTRFVHTSEGRCLITRVVPCPACLRDGPGHHQGPSPPACLRDGVLQALGGLEVEEGPRPRLSQESRASDGDSGVGAESNASSRMGSVEGVVYRGVVELCGWTAEECSLCAATGTQPRCAIHGAMRLRDLAPDLLLLDLEEPKRANWEHVTLRSAAGRGAFGTVWRGSWAPPGRPTEVVAVKALQPVPPPHTAPRSVHQAYKAAQSRWERAPAAGAARAYCALRQELCVLRRLAHAHVAPLRAACPCPPALLLLLAPKGSLDGVLRAYRSSGSRVPPRAARAAALQVARALDYLHAAQVLYRDLKSENVLVWAMPEPQEAAAAERSREPIHVHVKLGDYGISRLAPPSGTKGFGGTEGFMAPEIMRYNGEEEYNEKVDCFSFGMLLYEIVSLRQPFEGHEAIKEAVLDGARPALTAAEASYGCCVVETMRRCWSLHGALRPGAAALVCVCAAPEWTALAGAAAARPGRAGAARRVQEEGGACWEMWYCGTETERIHTLLATPHQFTQQYTVRLPPDKGEPVSATAVCHVEGAVWIGDSAGRVTVYSASTCALLWSAVVVESVGGAPSSVAALQPLPAAGRVALATAAGRLFLVSMDKPEAEGSFVLTELGTATQLHCLAAVTTAQGLEVWAGGENLSAYSVGASGVTAAHSLGLSNVLLLAATEHGGVGVYCEGDVCVQLWDSATRACRGKLDCSKLAPCSESLQSIAIDEHLGPEKCKVTALCSLEDHVYVGTTWGCVVVADAATLRPITVFRPYEEEVRAMVPLPAFGAQPAMLATLGNGYRPLLQRFAPQQSNNSNTSFNGFYCLLWRTNHWLPD